MNVRDYMIATPTIRSDMTVANAVDLMAEHRIRLISVVDKAGRFVGVLDAEDASHLRLDPILKDFAVFHFVRHGARVIDAGTSMRQAARLLEEHRHVDTLVVASEGYVEGLLTRNALGGAASIVASASCARHPARPIEPEPSPELDEDLDTVIDSSTWLG